ncbi:MAG: Ig-like domain-containing protein, partial [Ideonella sp.]
MAAAALALVGCGGGGADAGDSPFNPGTGETTTLSISLVLSSSTVTSAAPVTVTAKVLDDANAAVSGAKVEFAVAGSLGNLSATSALTDASGNAVVTLTPASTTASGADTVSASVTLDTVVSTATAGFQLTATDAEFVSLLATTGNGDAAGTPVAAYGQTTVNVVMTGVSEASPATVALSSSCVDSSKAAISPTNVTTTTGVFSVVYTDSGCGALFGSDTVTATLAGSSTLKQGTVFLSVPAANNMAFVSATPSTIYLRGSGLAESSTVLFQVNDTAGSPLPGQTVTLALTTYTGGLAIDGSSSSVVKTTDANGRVSAIVNSGTVPTPVRVSATLNSGVSTVSNVLAVGVGLPTQLAFSLSQTAANLDCYT